MAERLSQDELKQKMHERIDGRAARLHRYIDKEKIGGEEGRLWLDQFCTGTGLDVACGDFLIGLSIGIDTNNEKLGQTWVGPGDEILRAESESMDYVVSNYFDAFPSALKVLHEWSRVLKPGGTVAIVCANAEKYEKKKGPLENYRRANSFTTLTLPHYFRRAGFKVKVCEAEGSTLRLMGLK